MVPIKRNWLVHATLSIVLPTITTDLQSLLLCNLYTCSFIFVTSERGYNATFCHWSQILPLRLLILWRMPSHRAVILESLLLNSSPQYVKLGLYIHEEKQFRKIKSISVQTQLSSIYYIKLHVSTYVRSLSGSQLVFRTCWRRNVYYVSPSNIYNTTKHIQYYY
jgi:hypothetical protein